MRCLAAPSLLVLPLFLAACVDEDPPPAVDVGITYGQACESLCMRIQDCGELDPISISECQTLCEGNAPAESCEITPTASDDCVADTYAVSCTTIMATTPPYAYLAPDCTDLCGPTTDAGP